MATPPTSVNVKVTLLRTPMGSRAIQRLELPNIDKSAELRRLVELGMAAELAGFSLDGTALRFGGRVWDMRSELDHDGIASPDPGVPAPASSVSAASTSAPVSPSLTEAGSAAIGSGITAPSATAPRNGESAMDAVQADGTSLRANLRGLAGGS